MDPFVPSNPSLPSAALAALQQGRKIEAIKIVREREGLGLKDAKDRVERYVANDPMLKETFAASHKKGCLSLVAGLMALIGVGFFLFFTAKG
jgi:hypothetical protein